MFCSQCGTKNDDTAKFCQKCGSSLADAGGPSSSGSAGGIAPPPVHGGVPPVAAQSDPRLRTATPPVTATGKQYAVGKSPPTALILSILIPGVGQFYNNDVKKGAVMLGGAIVLGVLTLGLAWLGILIWSAIDAYQVASGKSPIW